MNENSIMYNKTRNFPMRTLTALAAMTLTVPFALAELGPKPPPADRFWGVLLVQSPIASGADYQQLLRFFCPDGQEVAEAMPKSMALELRAANTYEKVALFPFVPRHKGSVWDEWPSEYPKRRAEDARAALESLAPGDYVMALCHDGTRISNVATFTIDPEFDIENEPTLTIEALEPPPFRDLPFIGVRATGNQLLSTELRDSHLAYATPVVDGVKKNWFTLVWGGFDNEVQQGDRRLRILDIDGNLSPRIKRGVAYDISIETRGYTSATIHATPDRPLGDAWDAAVQHETKNQ